MSAGNEQQDAAALLCGGQVAGIYIASKLRKHRVQLDTRYTDATIQFIAESAKTDGQNLGDLLKL